MFNGHDPFITLMIYTLSAAKSKLSQPVKPPLDWVPLHQVVIKLLAMTLPLALAVLPWFSTYSSTATMFKALEGGLFFAGTIAVAFMMELADLIAYIFSVRYRERCKYVSGAIHLLAGMMMVMFAISITTYYEVQDGISIVYAYGGFSMTVAGLLDVFMAKQGVEYGKR